MMNKIKKMKLKFFYLIMVLLTLFFIPLLEDIYTSSGKITSDDDDDTINNILYDDDDDNDYTIENKGDDGDDSNDHDKSENSKKMVDKVKEISEKFNVKNENVFTLANKDMDLLKRHLINKAPSSFIRTFELSDSEYPVTEETKRLNFPFYFILNISNLESFFNRSLAHNEINEIMNHFFYLVFHDPALKAKNNFLINSFYNYYENRIKQASIPLKSIRSPFDMISYSKSKLSFYIAYIDLSKENPNANRNQKLFEQVIESMPNITIDSDFILKTYHKIFKMNSKFGDRVHGVIPINKSKMEWWENDASRDSFERFYIYWMHLVYISVQARIRKLYYNPQNQQPSDVDFDLNNFEVIDFLSLENYNNQFHMDNFEASMIKNLITKFNDPFLNIPDLCGILVYGGTDQS